MKWILVLGALAALNLIAFGGFWVTTPIDAEDYAAVMPLIVRTDDICDYDPGTGFLVDAASERYLAFVTAVPWAVVDKSDLNRFMDARDMLYCFHGGVRVAHGISRSDVTIVNHPVGSTRFHGQFLCGGSVTYHVGKRLPSLLNAIFGRYIIDKGMTIVS